MNKLKINKKAIKYVSLLTICSYLVLSSVPNTWALFYSDGEVSADNKFVAGILDLVVVPKSESDDYSEKITKTIAPVTESEDIEFDLKNAGTMDFYFSSQINGISDTTDDFCEKVEVVGKKDDVEFYSGSLENFAFDPEQDSLAVDGTKGTYKLSFYFNDTVLEDDIGEKCSFNFVVTATQTEDEKGYSDEELIEFELELAEFVPEDLFPPAPRFAPLLIETEDLSLELDSTDEQSDLTDPPEGEPNNINDPEEQDNLDELPEQKDTSNDNNNGPDSGPDPEPDENGEKSD